MPIEYAHDHDREITMLGEVNFRNVGRKFGIRTEDRRRHVYIIGKTGMGKSTLMENMIMSDILAGHGCCYIDPHGDTAEKMIDWIPPERINDVVYLNPADTAFPFGFNILENPSDDRKHLVRDGLMGVFKKIWPDVWSARMEYILQNCVAALLDYPGATLMGINRLLVDKEYREKVVEKIRDPVVKTFWIAEFASWSEKYATEAIAPVQNKVGQFLSSSLIRNIVAQTRSTVDIRKIMDEGKILIVNLSKGRVGEDGMRLLGGMIITKIQLSAQERQNTTEAERRDFYLYVDEFQNFANESFATILSEARKYRLNLIVAHQYMAQLQEEVQDAILGNVGTMLVMRIGPQDAELLETEFAPTFTPEDLVNLAKFQMYLKLMVDGVATQPFSANTLPPIAKRMDSAEKVIKVTRERYTEPRHVIEEKVLKWVGMEFIHGTGSATKDESGNDVPDVPGEDHRLLGAITSAAHYPNIKTREELEIEEASVSGDTAATTQPLLVTRPERQAAIEESLKASKQAQKMAKKPAFAHTCQRCGKTFELAVQLDPTKPIYDPECREVIRKEREERAARPAAPAPSRESRQPERPRREEPRPRQEGVSTFGRGDESRPPRERRERSRGGQGASSRGGDGRSRGPSPALRPRDDQRISIVVPPDMADASTPSAPVPASAPVSASPSQTAPIRSGTLAPGERLQL